jgi:hypothetical protein
MSYKRNNKRSGPKSKPSGKRPRSDEDLAAYLKSPAECMAPVTVDDVGDGTSIAIRYHCMELHRDRTGLGAFDTGPKPPTNDTQEEWDRARWVVRVPESGGSVRRIQFPVYSVMIDYDTYDKLEEHQKGRCVYETQMQKIFYCPREHINGTNNDGATVRNLYVANGVRYAQSNENPNCMFMVNPDWNADEPASTRVVLTTTMKVEKLHTYRLNGDYHRSFIDDELVSEEEAEEYDEPYISSNLACSSRDVVVSRAHLKRTPKVKGSKPLDAEEPSLTTLIESLLITMHTMNEFFQRHLMCLVRDLICSVDRMDGRLKDLVHTVKVSGNALTEGPPNGTAPRAGVAVAASVLAKEMDAAKLIPKRAPVVYARDTSSAGPVIRTPARTVDARSNVAAPEGKVSEIPTSLAKSVPSTQPDESADYECGSDHSYEPSQ